MLKDSSKSGPLGTDFYDPTRNNGEVQPVETKVPWSPWVAVLYAVIVYFLAQILAGAIVAVYPHFQGRNAGESSNWLNNSTVAQFWYVVFAEALTFGAIWWFMRLRKTGLRSIGWRKLETK